MRVYLATPGSEPALIDELGPTGAPRLLAPGVVAAEDGTADDADPVFARQLLPDASEIRAASVAALAEAAYRACQAAVDAWAGAFTLHAITPADIHPDAQAEPGLGSRVRLVGDALLALLRERRRRASRRYQAAGPAAGARDQDWLLVQLLALERGRLLVSAAPARWLPRGGTDLAPWPAGAAPVAVDRAPPSRAYQKLEEAFAWMGTAPAAGELCVDLGAAPGGWTMTALGRGAQVIAVDRAPLARPPAGHVHLTAVIGDAFRYVPPPARGPVDWLLGDVVSAPARTLALIESWLGRGGCRNLVVTVKFRGSPDLAVLAALPALLDGAGPAFARVKQLAHNKNEACVMMVGAAARARDRP